jgi:hypothetical protein
LSGLYRRALTIRNGGEELSTTDTGEFTFDESSGISKEDQKDILSQIDRLATESRIKVSQDVFTISPKKKGVLFPVSVNLFALLALAVGILTLAFFFRRGEELLTQETGALSTAEGLLLQELKRESQQRLNEKELEIEQIQGQLARIDQERQNLKVNMEAQVREREESLKAALEEELLSEREKLAEQGISEEDITVRLAALEEQKSIEYNELLTSYADQVENERVENERNLKLLEEEYNQNLSEINDERQQLLTEARQREDELRNQLEQEAAALESEKTKVEEELQRISEQTQRTDLVKTQIIGFYSTVQENINNADFDKAIQTLGSIKSYLNEESIVILPDIQQRREVEFFVIDSLAKLVEAEIDKEQVDSQSLIAAANVITSVRSKVIEADSLLQAGERDRAEELYREALSLIPEIQKSYDYFTERREEEEKTRESELAELLANAEEDFRNNRWEGVLDHYGQALAYLPGVEQDAILTNLQQVGYQQETLQARSEATADSEKPLASATELHDEKRYDEAIAAYIDVLARFPLGERSDVAFAGIKGALEAKNQDTRSSMALLQDSLDQKIAEIDSGQANATDRNERVANLEASIQSLQEELATKEQELAEARTELGGLSEENRKLEADRNNLTTEIGTLRSDLDALQQELEDLKQDQQAGDTGAATASVDEEEMNRLRGLEEQYESLKSRYQEYETLEDTVLSQGGSAGLLEGKRYLDTFLTSDPIQEALPRLWDRIKRYDRAFERAGREDGLQDAIDLIFDLSEEPPGSRLSFIEEEIVSNRDDEVLVELLEELRELVSP